MPKYMFAVKYTADGARGVIKEGGTKRLETGQKLAEALGGSIEGYYFAFGATDNYVIADLPDDTRAAAASLAMAGTGAMMATVTKLLTTEEMDEAARLTPGYRAPGQ
jgi:uncharacterized protein with GYD domain